MSRLAQPTDGIFDVAPAALVVERAAHGRGDEHTALTAPDARVEIADELVIEAYVQTHGHI
jgi:hypothetical protein